MSDWNTSIIEEFRANEGRVGGVFKNVPLLLLHNTGAKSGAPRVNPLAYQQLDNGVAVFASKGGAPSNPAWYHNVIAHPDTTIEIGIETRNTRARIAEGEERDAIWERQKQAVPTFAEYEHKTSRQIPVVVLEDR